jgi:16S rRNA (guanine527-N7)-methyltransferase
LRLADRARQLGLSIPVELASQLAVYFDLLQRWNRTMNLTGLGDSDAAIDRLLLEPVAAAKHLPANSAMLDIGSGGGSPAIPLALALPATSLAMVEAHRRKAAFLREAVRELAVQNVTIHAMRYEDLPKSRDKDLVTARAIKLTSAGLHILGDLLRPKGMLAIFGAAESVVAIENPELVEVATYPLPGALGGALRIIERK